MLLQSMRQQELTCSLAVTLAAGDIVRASWARCLASLLSQSSSRGCSSSAGQDATNHFNHDSNSGNNKLSITESTSNRHALATSDTPKNLGRRREAAAAAAAAARSEELSGPGLLAVLGAIAGVVRGVGGAGGLGAATFGLQALARRHEEQRVEDHPAGRELAPGPEREAEAGRLVEALELAHGAYKRSAAALAAKSCLRHQYVRVWRPEGGRLQPGYYIAIDHPGRRVVWAVRGTRVFADLLTDLAMAAHPLGPGASHWGMTHAAHWLLRQEATRVAALLRSLNRSGPTYRLELVGHSLGGSVAALLAVMLREQLVEAARSADIPAELISCTAFAPPGVMSPKLALLCRPYITSVVLNNDIVPRLNAASLALLREELQDVDWYAELQRTLQEHTIVKSLSSKLVATLSTSTPQLPPPEPISTPGTPRADPTVPAPLAPSTLSVLQPLPAAAAAASAVQQFSAAVLESAAFKAAVTSLDDWKAKAMAAAGDQAEVAIRRQAEIVRTWLQDITTAAAQPRAVPPQAAGNQAQLSASEGSAGGETALTPEWLPSAPVGDVRRAAESAAESLRRNVEAAVASVTAAAAASRDRLSASLPALPSLPQPHELPLVEPAKAAVVAAAVAAATAAATRAVAEARCADVNAVSEAVEGLGAESVVRMPTGAVELDTGGADAGRPASELEAQVVLPLLVPPGRVLYIRPHPDEPAVQCSADQRVDTGDRSCRGTIPDGGYAILELPAGHTFKRVVLGSKALDEHQCREYRRVLTQIARWVQ